MLDQAMEVIKHFTIIPNVHPIFVHFTIALVSIAFIMHILEYSVALAGLKNSLLNECGIVARWCLWLAMFFASLTALAGFYAFNTVAHDEAGHMAMQIHRNSALISFLLIINIGLVSILRFKQSKRPSISFLLLMLIMQLSVLITGYLGSEVVYRYGVGVIKAQTPDMLEGHHHSNMPEMPNSDGEHSE